MVKSIKRTFSLNGFVFDSKEEFEFALWLEVAKKYGLVVDSHYKPNKIKLCDSMFYEYYQAGKVKSKAIIRAKHYTPDWKVIVTKKFKITFPQFWIYQDNYTAWIDVKGTATFGAVGNSSFYTFPIKQAWIMQQHNIYINKVVCRPKKAKGVILNKGLFLSTFVPEQIAYIKNRKVKTLAKDFDNEHLKFANVIFKENEGI